LFLIGVGIVEVGVYLHFIGYTVQDNQRLTTTGNGGHTADTHGGSTPGVTGVGYNIQTGDASLQGFIYTGDLQAFKFLGIDGLNSCTDFPFRNGEPALCTLFGSLDHNLADGVGIVFEYDIDYLPVVDLKNGFLIPQVGNRHPVCRAFYL